MSDDRYDTNIVPLGRQGRAGRGNKSTTPSSAARALAGNSKPAAKKAVAKKAAAKKAPAKKPVTKVSETKQSAIKSTPAKKAATKKTADAQKQAPSAKKVSAKKAAPKPTQTAKKTAERPRLRLAPEPGTAEAAALSAEMPPQAEEHARGVIPLEDIVSAVVNGAQRVLGEDWEGRLARVVNQIRHRIAGDYEVDEFGFDEEIAKIAVAAAEPLIENWFRLQVRGIENIPETGGALLVANHSGTVPLDGVVTGYAVRKYAQRNMRPLGADLVFSLPFVGQVARKVGATLACTEDAERLLTAGELAAVWPEGFKGIGKPFSERYKLQRFGRGGFVSSAMRAGVPIVPVSIVGAEEIYPLVGNVPSLARLLGIPYLPVTPFFPLLGPLGMIPLPSKWIIEFGEPIRTDAYEPDAADDPMLLFEVTDQVRETIQQTLYKLLIERGNPFL